MNTRTKRLLLNFLMEMLIYGLLLLIYFLAVLRLLGEPFNQLFHFNSLVYALATLLIIVIQAGEPLKQLLISQVMPEVVDRAPCSVLIARPNRDFG